MARYWIADLHLGHAKVAELRGFTQDVGKFDDQPLYRHDETIMQQLRALSANDEVWVLGDISSGRPEAEERALLMLSFIPASLHLIAGNHDSVSSTHRHGYRQQRRFLEVFDSVQQFGRVRLHGRDVLMSHYPYARSGDGHGRGVARYAEYRLPDEGLPLIHGHTHQETWHMPGTLAFEVEATPGKRSGRYLYQTVRSWSDRDAPLQQFCVSWDAHRGLVTEHTLNEWIKGLP